MMQMPTVAPLFIADQQFLSTLVLVNSTAVNTYADVTLRGMDGRTIVQQRVNFSPHSQQQVDVGKLLASVASPATAGSILVMPSPDLNGSGLGAALSMTYIGSSEPNFIDEEPAMPSAMGSQTLRAVADLTNSSPLIAVSSLSDAPQRILVQCLGERGAISSKSVQLLAGETAVTDACTESTVPVADFQTILSNMRETDRDTSRNEDRKSPRQPAGITLVSDAMPGSFAAFGLSRRGNQADRYFSTITFEDPKLVQSSTTVFAGVPVGLATLLPEGNYTPEVLLANFSGKDAQVTMKYAHSSGAAAPGVDDLGNILLPAKTTKHLKLDGFQGDLTLENSFLFTSDGKPGDVVAKLFSTSESGIREVDLPGKDLNDPNNGGGHPWSLEDGTDSTLLLFNPSEHTQKFTVAIQKWAVSVANGLQSRTDADEGNRHSGFA